MQDEKDQIPSQPIDEEKPVEKEEPSPGKTVEEDGTPATVEPSEPTEKESEKDEEKPRSHRENLRIQQLVEKLRQQKPEPQELPKQDERIDYKSALDADDEVIQRLEADRKAASQASYSQGIARAEAIQFHTRLEIDAPKIAAKYPQLDRDSEDFNPVAANAINEWYLANVGYDPKTDTVRSPNVRYADFVEGVMELADEMAGHKVETTKKNIAKQAAATGLRPDGSSAKRLNLNQAPEAMTDEELDAIIGATIPSKKR